jgi:hypothetical protein
MRDTKESGGLFPFLLLHDQHAAWMFDGQWPGLDGPKDSGTMWSMVAVFGNGNHGPSWSRVRRSSQPHIWHVQLSRPNIAFVLTGS